MNKADIEYNSKGVSVKDLDEERYTYDYRNGYQKGVSMRTEHDFDMELYRDQLPRLTRLRKMYQALSTIWTVIAGGQFVVFGLSGLDNEMNLLIGGINVALAGFAIVRKKVLESQIVLIENDLKPMGVTAQLRRQLGNGKVLKTAPTELDMVQELEKYRAEGEKAALDEKSQWWRQPGSTWHQAQETIHKVGSELRDIEIAEAKVEAERIAKETAELKAQIMAKWAEQNIARLEREAADRIRAERDWDAFVEDAQISARQRKEAGDWYEPPVDLSPPRQQEIEYNRRHRGGVIDPSRTLDSLSLQERREFMARIAPDVDLPEIEFETIESWDGQTKAIVSKLTDADIELRRRIEVQRELTIRQMERSLGIPPNTIQHPGDLIFTPARGIPQCERTGYASYTLNQGKHIQKTLAELGDRNTRLFPCHADGVAHYHLDRR